MTRPRLAVAAAAAVAVLLAAAAVAATARGRATVDGSGIRASTKPNIVIVLTDDLSLNLISHMPRVQALQKAGTTMTGYYVVDSLCCPSRSAIFTGQYPHDDGVFTNKGSDGGYDAYNRNGNEKDAFAVSLHRAGYRTGFMGKYLNGYQTTDPVPPGWDEWDVADNGYKEFDYTLNENGEQHRYGHSPKDYLTDVVSAKGGDFIRAAASTGRPFLLEVATFAPHGPYTPAPRYADSDPNVTYPRTPGFDAVPTDAPSWLKGRAPLSAMQEQRIDVAYRERVRSVHAVDDLLAHLQHELKDAGVADNTYVVFSSDNGYHMGENRLMPGKQTAFDTDVHVPLVVAGPGVPAGRTVRELASNIDLAPTFETLGGARIPTPVDGVSLAALWHGVEPKSWQRAVLVEHHGPNNAAGDPDKPSAASGNPPSYEAIRTAGALYVRYAGGELEYYDTTTDRYELHNIAGRGVPAELTAALTALAGCHGAAQCQAAARVP